MTAHPCITNFLTDGSLIRVCEAAQSITGLAVSLRDARGRVIVRGDGERVFAAQLLDSSTTGGAQMFSAPLTISAGVIGSICVETPVGLDDSGAESIREFITNLAATVAEVCEGQTQLRRRIDELGVLYKLSSMLVGATTVDSVLKSALESAVSMLNAAAGSIRILDDDRRALQLRASVGLSPAYIRAAGSLPADRVCDCGALSGAVIVTPDIHDRDDFLHADALKAERLRGMASVGLVFRGQTLGLLRLYSHEQMALTASEIEVLQSIAQQIAAAVANARLLEAEASSRRVRRQLALASDVQRRMLPATPPDSPRLDIAARYESCFELGGDFYDVFCHEGSVALTLGDVVGKGVAAALLMSAVRATIRAYIHKIGRVDEVMALTNQAMCRDTQVNEFATVFLCVIDPETMKLGYCNAGHEPPVVVRVPQHRPPTTADIDELPIGGMVVGVDPSQRYQKGLYELQPGDVLLMHSDGLPDAMNFDGDRFGKRRVRKALLDALTFDANASADRIANHILWEMRRFTGLAKQTDDTTILVVRVRS